MSEGLNRVILLGNIGQDPELRYTGAGTAVLNLRLATSETYRDKNNERQEKTEWHNVVVWGSRGEGLSRVLMKGSQVLVEGGLRTSSFEKDGVTYWRTEVHAKEVCLAGRPAARIEDAAVAVEERASEGREAAKESKEPKEAPRPAAPPQEAPRPAAQPQQGAPQAAARGAGGRPAPRPAAIRRPPTRGPGRFEAIEEMPF